MNCSTYDREALEARKENKPANNAIDMAIAMGIEILMELILTMPPRGSVVR